MRIAVPVFSLLLGKLVMFCNMSFYGLIFASQFCSSLFIFINRASPYVCWGYCSKGNERARGKLCRSSFARKFHFLQQELYDRTWKGCFCEENRNHTNGAVINGLPGVRKFQTTQKLSSLTIELPITAQRIEIVNGACGLSLQFSFARWKTRRKRKIRASGYGLMYVIISRNACIENIMRRSKFSLCLCVCVCVCVCVSD
jgi:hypothetical protein